jgi:hypothetical protein
VPSAEGWSQIIEDLRFKSGEFRLRLARRSKRADDEEVDNYGSNKAYCQRLLVVYNAMRGDRRAQPPKASKLLSHVPGWAIPLQIKETDLEFSLKRLEEFPRLQAALANCTSYTPSKWLLEQELNQRFTNKAFEESKPQLMASSEELVSRYSKLEGKSTSWVPNESADLGKQESNDVYNLAADQRLAGIGLSGGGIRSATFCLGVLQALAHRDLLSRYDYISSVSGGGYIHQWLAAWIHREPLGVASVQSKMRPLPSDRSLARAPEQINWLRRYSSYLTPRRGLFTADTWTMGAIWFRNTFLNQIVLASFLAVCILIVRAVMHPFTRQMLVTPYRESLRGDELSNVVSVVGVADLIWQFSFLILTIMTLVWAAMGVSTLWHALSSITGEALPGGEPPKGAIGNFGVFFWIILPGFLLSTIVALVVSDIFRIHETSGDLIPCLYKLWWELFGRFHLMQAIWCIYVFALLLAVVIGGRAYESSKNNSRIGGSIVRKAGFMVAITLAGTIPLSSLSFYIQHGYRGANVRANAVALTNSLNKRLGWNATTVSGEGKQRGGQRNNKKNIARESNQSKQDKVARVQSSHPITPGSLLALFLPLLFFAVQFTAVRLCVGLLGRAYEESRREWLARYGGWAAMVGFLWLALGLIALVGPNIFYCFFAAGNTRRLVSAAVVAVIHAITLYSGSSSKTSGTPDPQKFFGYSLLDLVGIIGAPITILTILILVSGVVDVIEKISFNHLYLFLTVGWNWERIPADLPSLLLYLASVSGPFVIFCLAAGTLLLFGWRVDVNEFSLNPFYRDRLARCYTGASNGYRVPDPFTGFDDHTEASGRSGIALAELLPVRFGGTGAMVSGGSHGMTVQPPYDGPLPIFCSTVNLSFGEDLAFQDRKGASFFFNPLFSGYHVGWTAQHGSSRTTTYNGFVPTPAYAYRDHRSDNPNTKATGIRLASVCAISGAALSPNQGFSTQPALAFLMTLFNVRLGWWLANTRKPWIWPSELDQPTPNFGLRYLLSELFGYSDDTSNYVSLSDGGRFDNMGLYELVRRRCSLIVICDGEQDEKTTFEGMGLAIAKARIDFGVEIVFPPAAIEALTPNSTTGRSASHFAVGTIVYPPPPGGDSGVDGKRYSGRIIYLKTAFVGDEPIDLRHYKRDHPAFPQESTVNQWFTEPQFESYRRLGQLTAEAAIDYLTPQHF